MKVIIQTFLYCCLLTTVVHCVELELSPKLKTRLSAWMENRLRRDVSSVSAEKLESGQFVRTEDVRDTFIPHSSNAISVRTKRSKNTLNQSPKQDCTLGTCTIHDLAHRLHQLNNKHRCILRARPRDKMYSTAMPTTVINSAKK